MRVKPFALPALGVPAHEPCADEGYGAIPIRGQDASLHAELGLLLLLVDHPVHSIGLYILRMGARLCLCLNMHQLKLESTSLVPAAITMQSRLSADERQCATISISGQSVPLLLTTHQTGLLSA